MSNTGWHRLETKQYVAAKAEQDENRIDPIPYHIPALKTKAGSSDSEKESVRLWNTMQSKLIEAGLMPEK